MVRAFPVARGRRRARRRALRALVELVAPPVFDSRGEGRDGKDFLRRGGEVGGGVRRARATRT